MVASALLLALCSLVAVDAKTSKGFRLLTVPNASAESVNIYGYLTSIHVGAGQAIAGIKEGNGGRIFYQNGNREEFDQGLSIVLTDGGVPLFPSGLQLKPTGNTAERFTAHIDPGPGTTGVFIDPGSDHSLQPASWYFCVEQFAYYNGKIFAVLKHSKYHFEEAGCWPIKVLPICTELPQTSQSHDFIIDTPCWAEREATSFMTTGLQKAARQVKSGIPGLPDLPGKPPDNPLDVVCAQVGTCSAST